MGSPVKVCLTVSEPAELDRGLVSGELGAGVCSVLVSDSSEDPPSM